MASRRSLGTLTIDMLANSGGFEQGMDKAERASKKWRRSVEKDLDAIINKTRQEVLASEGLAFAMAQGSTSVDKFSRSQTNALRATERLTKAQDGLTASIGRTNFHMSQSGKLYNQTRDSSRLATHELTNLTYQLQDVVVGLSSGQKPLTVFIQQGSQIAGIAAASGKSFKQMGTAMLGLAGSAATMAASFIFNPLVLGLAAVVGTATFALNRFADSINASSDFDTFVDDLGLATDQVEDFKSALEDVGGFDVGKWDTVKAFFKNLTEYKIGFIPGGIQTPAKTVAELAQAAKDFEKGEALEKAVKADFTKAIQATESESEKLLRKYEESIATIDAMVEAQRLKGTAWSFAYVDDLKASATVKYLTDIEKLEKKASDARKREDDRQARELRKKQREHERLAKIMLKPYEDLRKAIDVIGTKEEKAIDKYRKGVEDVNEAFKLGLLPNVDAVNEKISALRLNFGRTFNKELEQDIKDTLDAIWATPEARDTTFTDRIRQIGEQGTYAWSNMRIEVGLYEDALKQGLITQQQFDAAILNMRSKEYGLAAVTGKFADGTTFGLGDAANGALLSYAAQFKGTMAELQEIGKNFYESLGSGISDAFARSIVQGDSFKDSMYSLSQTILTQLVGSIVQMGIKYALATALGQQMTAAQIAGITAVSTAGSAANAKQVAESSASLPVKATDAALTNAATFGAGAIAGSIALGALLALALGSIKGFATGGYVSGPGSGTSDSMVARLSNGEFVVNANATSRYRPELEAINSGKTLAPVSVGGNMRVTVENNSLAQISARRISENDVRIIAEEIVATKTDKYTAGNLANANSRTSKSLYRNTKTVRDL